MINKKISCLLDACTVINLIHIDEDDFLLKKLDTLYIEINDFVFTEIKSNVYVRLDLLENKKNSHKEYIRDKKKSIEQKLSFFRRKISENNNLKKELGEDYFEKIRNLTKYDKKTNGELYCAAHAIYLSRSKSEKVFFYTDDFPAKDFFTPFFDYQQIGHIKDSVDLLTLLYWSDDNFTEQQFKNTLSNLHSQYATDVRFLLGKIESFKLDKVDAKFQRSNKVASEQLNLLIQNLRNLEFDNLKKIRDFFEKNKAKYREINDMLIQFSSVFELSNSGVKENLLKKIQRTIRQIDSNKIHKLLDLCP